MTSLDDGKTKGFVWKLVGIAANTAKSGITNSPPGALAGLVAAPLEEKKTARAAKVHSGPRNSSSTGDALS